MGGFATFSDAPPGTSVQSCPTRGSAAKKKGGWNPACVMKILCAKDKALVDQLGKSNVQTADEVWFDDPIFDGKKWTTKRFDAGGTSVTSTKTIMILADQSCEQAAVTCFHEVHHQNQPAGMKWPHPAEDDAYLTTEAWTIDRGLPSQGTDLRTTDPATGKVIADPVKVGTMVQKVYPSPPPAKAGVAQPIPVGQRNGVAGPETQVQDPVTGATSWRPSQTGDTFAGAQKTSGFKTVNPAVWKCP